MIQSKFRKNRPGVLTHIIISPNLKKIHNAVFEIQSGTHGRTDGQTDGRTQTHDIRLRPIGR